MGCVSVAGGQAGVEGVLEMDTQLDWVDVVIKGVYCWEKAWGQT